jgi:hypothetical protein
MLSQEQVEAEIVRLSGLAEKVTTAMARRAVDAANADATYKCEFAKALLQTEGTVAEREAQATIATQNEYRAYRITEAKFKTASEAGRNYRAQLDALRSLNTNLRALVTN